MFLRNLNVFIACLVVAAMTVAAPVALLVSVALRPLLGERGAGGYMFPAAYVLVALILVFVWWKSGLSPAKRKPEHERRFNIGHGVLALINILAICAIVVPMLLVKVSGNSNLGILGFVVGLPIYALGYIAWPAGLFMVWSSRA